MDKALANTLADFEILERIAKGHRKPIPRFFLLCLCSWVEPAISSVWQIDQTLPETDGTT